MNIKKVEIGEIKLNPNNPRIIKDNKYRQLVDSIKKFPKMLELRPIVVNKDGIILGGNMRFKACKDAGLRFIPVVIADELTEEEQKQFIIKDNIGYGEWDWELLNLEWDIDELKDWGLDIPNFEGSRDDMEEGTPLGIGWFLNIEFEDEGQCKEWYDKLISEGLICKIVQ